MNNQEFKGIAQELTDSVNEAEKRKNKFDQNTEIKKKFPHLFTGNRKQRRNKIKNHNRIMKRINRNQKRG